MSTHNEQPPRHDPDRRRLLSRGAQAAGAVSLVGLLLGSYGEQAASRPIAALLGVSTLLVWQRTTFSVPVYAADCVCATAPTTP